MSLYDNPLPPADYAAYLALREEMCDLALPYLGHYLECQKALLELKMFLDEVEADLTSATTLLGETLCRVQFIGRDVAGRWQWAWNDPPGTYPAEALRDALHLKAYGEQHGIEWLTRSGWPITAYGFAYGQLDALRALAVMLNHADGYCWNGTLYRLKERLPNMGRGSMLVTVYLRPCRHHRAAKKASQKSLIKLFISFAVAIRHQPPLLPTSTACRQSCARMLLI